MVYLSIINKINSGKIDECVRDRWRVSEIGDECPRYDDEYPRYDDECSNLMTTSVVLFIRSKFGPGSFCGEVANTSNVNGFSVYDDNRIASVTYLLYILKYSYYI